MLLRYQSSSKKAHAVSSFTSPFMLNILILLLILILQIDPSRSFQVLFLSKYTPSITKSKTLYSSPAKKGFGSTSSVTTSISNDDAKRKGTLEKLEQWAQSVQIA